MSRPEPIAVNGTGPSPGDSAHPHLTAALAARLVEYRRCLGVVAATGRTVVSSKELAEAARLCPATLRRDLSVLGATGIRGVGYDVDALRRLLDAAVESGRRRPVVVFGAGPLAVALATDPLVRERGFHVVAVVDPRGTATADGAADIPVWPLGALPELCAPAGVDVAVLATAVEAGARGKVFWDALRAAGITRVLDLTGGAGEPPAGLTIRRLDLSVELLLLGSNTREEEVSAS